LSGPKLRQFIDIQTFEYQGQHFFVLRDPLGLSPQPAVIPAYFGSLLLAANGATPLTELERIGGEQGIPPEITQKIFSELDDFCLLENERYALEYQRVLTEYQNSPIRVAALAGAVYAPEANALRDEISHYLETAEVTVRPKSKRIRAAMAPHIDYLRGMKTYGATFRYLQEVDRPDVIVLIGTCHKPSKSRFILSQKDFEIPLGTFRTDRELCEKFLRLCGSERLLGEEILHKGEHSLELQLPYLASLYGESLPRIVPIIVGSFHDAVTEHRPPREIPEIRDFIDALSEITRETIAAGENIWLFGGVDLAHVGVHFGDQKPVAPVQLPEIEKRDLQLIDTLLANDADSLFLHIAEDADARRICGFPSLYVMLDAMKSFGETYRPSLIEYRQAVDVSSDCTVSFAGLSWEIE